MLDLPTIWAGLLAVAIFIYVVLDGFDLGIGVLFPLFEPGKARGTAMNTVAPVWDGNETWLVLGGGGLLAAFPLAYSIVLPALYAPFTVMILALVLRGVAFEFRWRDPKHEKIWDLSFTAGSLAATFSQGIVLGAFVQGIEVDGRAYGGGWFDWMTPFSLMCGLALVAGYGLLGATWLVMKTEGEIRERAYQLARPFAVATFIAVGIVSLWSPFLSEDIAARWFSMPNMVLLAPMPLLVVVLGATLGWALWRRKDYVGFPATIGLYLVSFIGLGVTTAPYVVPRAVTIHEAAAPAGSLGFMLVGALILLPMILGYTAYSYWVFRGKVRADQGYH